MNKTSLTKKAKLFLIITLLLISLSTLITSETVEKSHLRPTESSLTDWSTNPAYPEDGWYFAGPTLAPEHDIRDTICSSDEFGNHSNASCDLIYFYNSSDSEDPWKIWNESVNDSENDIDTLTPVDGYWIHVEEEGETNEIEGVHYSGIDSAVWSRMEPGWNTMSWNFTTNSISEMIPAINGNNSVNITHVWRIDELDASIEPYWPEPYGDQANFSYPARHMAKGMSGAYWTCNDNASELERGYCAGSRPPMMPWQDQPPELTDMGVTEEEDGTYTFHINYTDPQGQAPNTKHIYINEEPYEMNHISGDYEDNARYEYNTELEPGNNSYYYVFNNTIYETQRPWASQHPDHEHRYWEYVNYPPVANFTYTELEWNKLKFNASESYDPDGEIVSYDWILGDQNEGNEATLTTQKNTPQTPNTLIHTIIEKLLQSKKQEIQLTEPMEEITTTKQGEIINHTYEEPGNYTVTLTVTDNDEATDTTNKTIEIKPNPPEIELNNPQHEATETTTSPTLNITVTDPDDHLMNVTLYDASNDTELYSEENVENGTHVTHTWENLEHETTYHWYAEATDKHDTTTSPTWNFTTEKAIEVKTHEATDITTTTATLQGELTQLNTEQAETYFQYQKQGETTWINTTKQTLNQTQEFNQEITELEPETTYEYRAIAEANEHKEIGETKTFTTLPTSYFEVTITNTNSPIEETETLKVNTTITNTGDETDTQNITLEINGNQKDSKTINLSNGETKQITLTWQTQEGDAGNHTATVSSQDESDHTEIEVTTTPEEVKIYTDKEEYTYNETIQITVENNINETITIASGYGCNPGQSPEVHHQNESTGEWKNVGTMPSICGPSLNVYIPPQTINPEQNKTWNWELNRLINPSKREPGTHRAIITYKEGDYGGIEPIIQEERELEEVYTLFQITE